MITVMIILAVTAFVAAIASAAGKLPLWVAVIILTLIELLRAFPLGR